jgi:hypothetical protein
MKVIDADSHVYEVEETWNYLPKKYQNRRPLPITIKPEDAPYMGVDNTFWMVDGKSVQWTWGKGTVQIGCPLTSTHANLKVFSIGSQSLRDVEQRVRDLDKAGVDLQVIYPTLFLVPLSEDDAFETALMYSYNSWINERCSKRPDRLRWAALLPLREPEEAVREIRRVKEMGAVSLCTYGTVGEKMLHAREFDPVWQAASDSGLPVCVHVGWSYPPLRQMCDEHVSSLNLSFTLPVMFGFLSFLGGGILDRFPALRVAFLEAGAGWMPWFLDRIDHYHGVSNFFRKSFGMEVLPSQRPKTYRDRVFVTCEADEMLLPQVIQYLGEDNIMVSEDMPHFEERAGSVQELARREDVTEAVKKKILLDNPKRFYNLS